MQGNPEVVAAFVGGLDGGVQVVRVVPGRKVNYIHLGAQLSEHRREAFRNRRCYGVFFKPVSTGSGVVGMAYINGYFPGYFPLIDWLLICMNL